MNFKTAILTTLLAVVVSVFTYTHAATRYVSHSGDNTFPYTTWQTAASTIETANLATLPGDTMFIDTGSYQLTQTIVLQPKITLRGKGMDSTTILGDSAFYDMFQPKDSTYVQDIRFEGNGCFRALTKYYGGGTFAWWIQRCSFFNFSNQSILADLTKSVEVRHCWFQKWGEWGGAISVRNGGNCRVTNCTFYAPDQWLPICDFGGNGSGHIVFDSNIVVGGARPPLAALVVGDLR